MSQLKTVFCLILLSAGLANTSNILVLEELPSGSHHIWLRSLINGLAAAGHNVTSLSDTVYPNPPKGVHYIHLEKLYENFVATLKDGCNLFELGNAGPLEQLLQYYDLYEKQCSWAIDSNGWRQLMEYPDDFKFDLVIHDFAGGFCYLSFLDKFHYPPLITATASKDVVIAASMQNMVVNPAISDYIGLKDLQITLIDRLYNYMCFVVDIGLRIFHVYPRLDSILRERANLTIPSVSQLNQRSELLLMNLDPMVTGIDQLPPNLIRVGGLQIQPPRAISGHLQEIFETSTKGVVLFSLGTNVPLHMAGTNKLVHIFEAFRRMPEFTFLCKIDASQIHVDIPENVKLEMWLPQNDILAHPKTVLFMTHNGLLSTQEAIWYGVPMLGMPVFLDQHLHAAQSQSKGIGLVQHWDDLTTESLYTKLDQLLNNSTYKKNIKKYSVVFRDQKESPLERAIWWIEWVIRNPKEAQLLKQRGSLNFVQGQSIDVIAILLTCVLIVIGLLFILTWLLVRWVVGYRTKSKRD